MQKYLIYIVIWCDELIADASWQIAKGAIGESFIGCVKSVEVNDVNFELGASIDAYMTSPGCD